MSQNLRPDHGYGDAGPTWSNQYLWPVLRRIVAARDWPDKRAFEIGCGNGATADLLSRLGFEVKGIDSSESGVAVAREAYPHLQVAVGDAYDDLVRRYGTFPLVVSLEVIEHCFYPRQFVRTFFDLMERGG